MASRPAEERIFWEENDSTDFMDFRYAEQVIFPNHTMNQPTTKSISLRLPEMMPTEIKAEANKRDIPYQSLIKMWLSESLAKQGV